MPDRTKKGAGARDTAESAALIDPATGLASPRLFDLEGAGNLAFARRYCRDLAVIYFRLDGLDRARETPHGPLDEVLVREFVRCLRREVRTEDTVARLGTDRFAVLAREMGAIGARQLTRRLLHRMRDLRGIEADLRQLSVGIATPRAYHCQQFAEYRALAARCLDSAIQAGGNRVVAAHDKHTLRKLRETPKLASRLPPPATTGERAGLAPEQKIDVTMWLIEEGFIDQIEPDEGAAARFAPLLENDREQVQLDLGDVRVQLSRG